MLEPAQRADLWLDLRDKEDGRKLTLKKNSHYEYKLRTKREAK